MKHRSMVGKRLKDGYGVCVTECGNGKSGQKKEGVPIMKKGKGERELQRGNLDANDI